MSWNKPSSVSQPPPKKSAPPSLKRGLLAGLLVIALGALCCFMFRPSAATPKRDSTKGRGLIKAVTPAPAPKAVGEEVPEKPERKKDWWETDNTNGFTKVQQHVWKMRREKPAYVASAANRKKSWWNVFDHYSETIIAGFLTMKPGQAVVGNLVYDRVDADFLESLKTPIIATKDDPPEIAELKRVMNQTKIDLKARMDAGERLSDILEETHKELFRLGQVKQDLEKMVREQVGEESSKQDVEDLVAAANRMLEEKGIAPISAGPIIRNKLRMHNYVAPDEKDDGDEPEQTKEN